MDDEDSNEGGDENPVVILFSDNPHHIEDFIAVAGSYVTIWEFDCSNTVNLDGWCGKSGKGIEELERDILSDISILRRLGNNRMLVLFNCERSLSDRLRRIDYQTFSIFLGKPPDEKEWEHYDKIQEVNEVSFTQDIIKIIHTLTKPIALFQRNDILCPQLA